jgi:hypothetical protein
MSAITSGRVVAERVGQRGWRILKDQSQAKGRQEQAPSPPAGTHSEAPIRNPRPNWQTVDIDRLVAAARRNDIPREPVYLREDFDPPIKCTTRLNNCLRFEGVSSLREVAERTAQEWRRVNNFGGRCLSELALLLREHGLKFSDEPAPVQGSVPRALPPPHLVAVEATIRTTSINLICIGDDIVGVLLSEDGNIWRAYRSASEEARFWTQEGAVTWVTAGVKVHG